jgi:arylsulfatase A-like enzyme
MYKKPNIVFVLTDDQGSGDLGCLGNPVIETPHLDKFYKESVRLTNYHVGPTCAPTRSGLISGHYSNSTGVWHTVGGRSLLRGNEVSIANVFNENGYATGLFGKWHLGDNYPYRPQDRGFQEVITHGGGGISQMPDYWQNDYFDDTYYVNGEPRKFEGYCTDVWFHEGLSFIERNKEKPFLCFITPNAPHSPFNVEPEYSDRYKGRADTTDRERFYGMITNIDENVGLLRNKLDDLNLTENTILIFMTDNGSSAGCELNEDEFVINGYNAGLRGRKGSPYDGGHRVPFFIHWPQGDLIDPQNVETITSFVDFMPTMMDLCDIDLRKYEDLNLHGNSLKPLLTQKSPHWPDRVITTDSQRLPNPVKWRQSAVMTDKWRLINGQELYDSTNDREQRYNIADKNTDVVKNLRKEYEIWWNMVSGKFEEEIPISIGSDFEVETCLRSHDWRHPDNPHESDPFIAEDNSYVVFDQKQIRLGLGMNGYLEILVEKAGRYQIELRRWPKEENRPIIEGIEESDDGWRSDILGEYRKNYSGGTAMPFRKAKLKIGNEEWEKEIHSEDKGVLFEVELKQGPTHLASTFIGENQLIRGAYYVYAKKI